MLSPTTVPQLVFPPPVRSPALHRAERAADQAAAQPGAERDADWRSAQSRSSPELPSSRASSRLSSIHPGRCLGYCALGKSSGPYSVITD